MSSEVEPPAPIRVSVATKIFLGFAMVILAFGSASAFTLYRMSSLRETVVVLWQELMPLSNQLRSLSRQLKSADEFLALRQANDSQWLTQILPALEPFDGSQGFLTLADRLDQVALRSALTSGEQRSLLELATSMRRFASERELLLLADPKALSYHQLETSSSRTFYEALVKRVVSLASANELGVQSFETQTLSRALRRMNREVNDLVRTLAIPISTIERRSEVDEQQLRMISVVIACFALVISMVMLAIALLTLRPIRKLSAQARKIAAGDYGERVEVRSGDEIGQLAQEFNRMASSLQQRDQALVQKQSELVEAERLAAIGRLAAQITHEVRNPLSSIGLNAELLEEELELLDEAMEDGGSQDVTPAREMLTAISGEVQRLKDITEQYLQLTRLSTRSQSETSELMALPGGAQTELIGALERFITFLAREARTHEVTLSLHYDLPKVWVRIEEGQLRQVLHNLAKNALEALSGIQWQRWIRVCVTVEAEVVRVEVQDNGPGLTSEFRERLFVPFVSAKENGTGLGLVVSREIVRSYQGELNIEDIPESLSPHGTNVCMVLQRVLEATESEELE